MRGLFFDGWIQIFSAKSLNDISQNAPKTLVFFVPKQLSCLFSGNQVVFQFINCLPRLAVLNLIRNIKIQSIGLQ